jgi:hypothetical protein
MIMTEIGRHKKVFQIAGDIVIPDVEVRNRAGGFIHADQFTELGQSIDFRSAFFILF